MKDKILKYINKDVFKGLIAIVIFELLYTFAFALIFGTVNPLQSLVGTQYESLYIGVNILIGLIPYFFCGYILTMGRNSFENLYHKTRQLAFVFFVLLLSQYLVVTLLEFLFEYRSFYNVFISLNYPVTRSLLFIDSKFIVNLFLLLSTVLTPFAFYLGSIKRLKDLEKEDNHG